MKVRVALLLHELPDGSSHIDVLVARDGRLLGDDESAVPTWRCSTRPDMALNGSILSLDQIGEHRAMYLRLGSPRDLGGARGRVTPLRCGAAELRADMFVILWDDKGESWWSIREADGGWQLCVERNETGQLDFPTTDGIPSS